MIELGTLCCVAIHHRFLVSRVTPLLSGSIRNEKEMEDSLIAIAL